MTLEGEQREGASGRERGEQVRGPSDRVFVAPSGGGAPDEMMARMMRAQGPLAADTQLRHAISQVWQLLPEDRRNVDVLEERVRALVDRIRAQAREDAAAFGFE